jgi:hypothetical protein
MARPTNEMRLERRREATKRTAIPMTADASRRPKSPDVIGVSPMRWISDRPLFLAATWSTANLALGATGPQGLAGAGVGGVVVFVAGGVDV